jgi:DNA-binding response OmpR family regulator
MREALCGSRWDAVISELDLPGFPLADVLTVLRETAFATPLVVVTHAGEEDAEMAALAAGADDYVSKSRLTRLVPALKRSLAAAAARDMHGMVGELITVLASDVNWLADNVTGHEASGRIQNLQRVLEGAQARAAHHMRVLQPPRPIYK